MRYKNLDIKKFREKLIRMNIINTKHQVAWSVENLNAIYKASGLKTSAFSLNVRLQHNTLKCLLDGSTSPTLMTLAQFRHETGIIFHVGANPGRFEANVRGLRQVIEKRGFTQIELAIKAGVNKHTINRFLNENAGVKTGLTIDIWAKLAVALRCRFYVPALADMDYIIATGTIPGTDPMKEAREAGMERYRRERLS